MKQTQSYPPGFGTQCGLCLSEVLPLSFPEGDLDSVLAESDPSSGNESDADMLDDLK